MTANTSSLWNDVDDLEARRLQLDKEIKEFHKKFYDRLMKWKR